MCAQHLTEAEEERHTEHKEQRRQLEAAGACATDMSKQHVISNVQRGKRVCQSRL